MEHNRSKVIKVAVYDIETTSMKGQSTGAPQRCQLLRNTMSFVLEGVDMTNKQFSRVGENGESV